MRVYETILSILDEKGPLPIPKICREVNEALSPLREKPLLPSQIKSIVSRKKDLFLINGEKIVIHPDIHPISLTATIERFGGISYKIQVHFLKNRFLFWVWRNRVQLQPFTDFQTVTPGSMEEFKRELYFLKLWEWDRTYRKGDGIILDGVYWSVKLQTNGKYYECEGTESFPANWTQFLRAAEKLIGVSFWH